MSYAIDANILVYAAHGLSQHNRRSVAFLQECAAKSEALCLAWITIMAFLRVTTDGRVMREPYTLEQAMDHLEPLLALPQAQILTERDGFWDVYRQVGRGAGIRGKLVPDAHLAALLMQHGVTTLYTNDTDFRKFDFLDVRNPLA